MLRQSASYCRPREAFSNGRPSKVLCLQKKNVEKEQKNSKSINTINTIIFLAKNFFQFFFQNSQTEQKNLPVLKASFLTTTRTTCFAQHYPCRPLAATLFQRHQRVCKLVPKKQFNMFWTLFGEQNMVEFVWVAPNVNYLYLFIY